MTETSRQQDHVTIWGIFLIFFRIGLITFGGGLAMIAGIRHEIIHKRKWITEDSFLSLISVATSFPGALAVNIAFMQGYRLEGAKGVVAAVVGVVLPPFLVILAISAFFMRFLDNPAVVSAFEGAAIAVTGLIAYSAYLFGKEVVSDVYSIVVAVLAVAASFAFDLHPLLVILLSTILRFILPSKKAR